MLHAVQHGEMFDVRRRPRGAARQQLLRKRSSLLVRQPQREFELRMHGSLCLKSDPIVCSFWFLFGSSCFLGLYDDQPSRDPAKRLCCSYLIWRGAVPQEEQGTIEKMWERGLHGDIARRHHYGERGERGHNLACSSHHGCKGALMKTQCFRKAQQCGRARPDTHRRRCYRELDVLGGTAHFAPETKRLKAKYPGPQLSHALWVDPPAETQARGS